MATAFKDDREKAEHQRKMNKYHGVKNFSEKTIRKIENMKQDETLTDYTIVVEGEEFKVHKLMLVCYSDYFQAMLTRVGMKESQEDSVILQDETITKAGFDVFLDLAYSGRVLIKGAILRDTVACMSHLQVQEGLTICEDFIKNNLSTWNFLEFLNIAEDYVLEKSIAFCYEFILPHFVWYFENIPDHATQLTVKQFENIIPKDGVINESEKKVFDVVCQWLEHDEENRLQYVPLLMQHVRFSIMNPNDLDLVKKVEYVKNDPDCKAFLKEALDYQSAPLPRQLAMQNSRTEVRSNPSLFMLTEKQDGAPYNKAYSLKFRFTSGHLMGTKYRELAYCLKETVLPSIAVCRGFIFVCGGFQKANKAAVSDCCFYDPRFNRWCELPKMQDARADFALVPYKDEMLIAVGGTRLKIHVLGLGDLITQSVEIFMLDTQQWSMITALPDRIPVKNGIPMNEKNMIYVISTKYNENGHFNLLLGLKINDDGSFQWETLEEWTTRYGHRRPMLGKCADKVYLVDKTGSNSLYYEEAFVQPKQYDRKNWNIGFDTHVTCIGDFKAICMENDRLYAIVEDKRGDAYLTKEEIQNSTLKFEEFFQFCDFPPGIERENDKMQMVLAKIPCCFLPQG
ncbi:unnamed protein product [Owenia fusiformis]|uniref:Uncharacterized protein n=1 Tax=Owenia fusiformis TaxID=6347 RepID=A0A8J1Y3M9_OWEFU|nr:unnamed protein product [Owenia fusiformis]